MEYEKNFKIQESTNLKGVYIVKNSDLENKIERLKTEKHNLLKEKDMEIKKIVNNFREETIDLLEKNEALKFENDNLRKQWEMALETIELYKIQLEEMPRKMNLRGKEDNSLIILEMVEQQINEMEIPDLEQWKNSTIQDIKTIFKDKPGTEKMSDLCEEEDHLAKIKKLKKQLKNKSTKECKKKKKTSPRQGNNKTGNLLSSSDSFCICRPTHPKTSECFFFV